PERCSPSCVGTPTVIHGVSNVESIGSSEGKTCFVLSDGSAKCLEQYYGWLNESVVESRVLNEADVDLRTVEEPCLLTTGGEVQCPEGFGLLGERGRGPVTNGELGGSVLGDAVELSSGGSFVCALLGDGGVDCWGENLYGRLG